MAQTRKLYNGSRTLPPRYFPDPDLKRQKISLEVMMGLRDHLAFGKKNFFLSTNVFNNKLAYV